MVIWSVIYEVLLFGQNWVEILLPLSLCGSWVAAGWWQWVAVVGGVQSNFCVKPNLCVELSLSWGFHNSEKVKT